MPILATLCHILKGEKVLLQKKSKGLFGADKWNGVGGKLKQNETPEEGVKREVFEEAGLKIPNPEFHGDLSFYFGHRNKPDWIVHVFSVKAFEGKPRPSEEGLLRWFAFKEIPYDEM
jgi:8-oxo-dGTP pyrophosphatase MutT (NUDIX family)